MRTIFQKEIIHGNLYSSNNELSPLFKDFDECVEKGLELFITKKEEYDAKIENKDEKLFHTITRFHCACKKFYDAKNIFNKHLKREKLNSAHYLDKEENVQDKPKLFKTYIMSELKVLFKNKLSSGMIESALTQSSTIYERFFNEERGKKDRDLKKSNNGIAERNIINNQIYLLGKSKPQNDCKIKTNKSKKKKD